MSSTSDPGASSSSTANDVTVGGGSDGNNNDELITIHLTIPSAPGAPRVPLQLNKVTTPTQLRRWASERTQIPLPSLKLIFTGRLINDDDIKNAVTEYKLEDGSVLHCMGKPATTPTTTAASKNGDATITTATAVANTGGSGGARVLMGSGAAATTSAAATAAATASRGAVSLSSLPNGVAMDPLSVALQQLRAQASSTEQYITAVTTLYKILINIEQHPLEEKYRKVKLSNAAFQRRLGSLPGGVACMLAAGFISMMDPTSANERIYFMHATEAAWHRLVSAKALVQLALHEAEAATTTTPAPTTTPLAAAAAIPDNSHLGGSMPHLPSLQQMQAMMQQMEQGGSGADLGSMDPAALQAAQQMLQSNPALAHQVQAMIQNPTQMHQVMHMMQTAMQEQQQQNDDPNRMRQMREQMAQFLLQQQQQQHQVTQVGGGTAAAAPAPSLNETTDEELTEEEMIAEAIRRSLQE